MEHTEKTTRGSKGGQIMAIRQRQEALDRYYQNPNKCKHCNRILDVLPDQKIQDIRRKQFCDKSCAAKFNNIGRNRHRAIDPNQLTHPTKYPRKPNVVPLDTYRENNSIITVTKGDLFDKRTSWQNARSSIQKHARSVYFSNASHTHCCMNNCLYDIHIDVAHIKPVCEFDDSDTVGDINRKENLMGLCKNHHWEFDNGYLTLSDITLPFNN